MLLLPAEVNSYTTIAEPGLPWLEKPCLLLVALHVYLVYLMYPCVPIDVAESLSDIRQAPQPVSQKA